MTTRKQFERVLAEAARVLGLDQSIITACLKGRLKDIMDTHSNTCLRCMMERRSCPVPDHVWRDGKRIRGTRQPCVSPKLALIMWERIMRLSQMSV